MTGRPQFDRIIPALSELKWPPIKKKSIKKALTFKCRNALAPHCLCKKCIKRSWEVRCTYSFLQSHYGYEHLPVMHCIHWNNCETLIKMCRSITLWTFRLLRDHLGKFVRGISLNLVVFTISTLLSFPINIAVWTLSNARTATQEMFLSSLNSTLPNTFSGSFQREPNIVSLPNSRSFFLSFPRIFIEWACTYCMVFYKYFFSLIWHIN